MMADFEGLGTPGAEGWYIITSESTLGFAGYGPFWDHNDALAALKTLVEEGNTDLRIEHCHPDAEDPGFIEI